MAETEILFTTDDGTTFKAPTLKLPNEQVGFDGPLDLLLYLIQQSEVNIYDIPIAQITEQFLAYLASHQDMELGVLSSFYRMASQLILIKSKMLLPNDVEFDEEYEDPRKELVEQLIEYQKFKKYTQLLEGESNGEFVVLRKENDFFLPFSDEELFQDATIDTLLETFRGLMKGISGNKLFNIYESVSINEKLTLIRELLETHEEITLEQVIVHMDSKLDIICSFMAILEACRWNQIAIAQSETYGTITIRKKQEEAQLDDKTADAIDEQYDQMLETMPEKELDEEQNVVGPLHEETEARHGHDDDEAEGEPEDVEAEGERQVTYSDDGEEEVITLDDEEDGDGEDNG